MKILFITPRFPYPPLKGDQVVPYHRLRILGRRHEITLLSFYEKDEELAGIEQLSPFCHAIHTVRLPKWRSLLNVALMGPFSGLPLQVLYFRSEEFDKKIQDLMANKDFDIIHTYMLRMAEYTKDLDKPKVVDLIESMQLNFQARVSLEKYPQKIVFQEELKRTIKYETEIVKKYDSSIVVSGKDRDAINSDNITAISLGIDTNIFNRASNLLNNKTILFSGNMGYFPNESAIIWFIENCFDNIKTEIPDVKLKIVGTNPSAKIKNFHDGISIYVTGFVESMADELCKAHFVIAPMRSGYGMHLKILEAMSCGLPVITTTLGLGVIEAIPEENVIIADNASAFSKNCVRLLNNYELAQKIGNNARELVKLKYSWESNVNEVEKIYKSILTTSG